MRQNTRQSALITVMVRAAEKAARGLLRDFGELQHLQVSKKGPADFVSAADLRADKILRQELSKARPDFGFLSEESGESTGKPGEPRWVIDPLDGTTNFLHAVPHFSISIGVEKDGDIWAGIIYDPVKDEMFWGEKGQGAFLNDTRLRVSARKDMSEALFATGIPFKGHGNHPVFLSQLDAVMNASSGVRRFGSAALDLAYVAAGRFDGFWENPLNPWDMAAGILLIQEAGGSVSEIDGGKNMLENCNIVAGNASLFKDFRKLVQDATPTQKKQAV